MININRRSFLKAAGVGGAVAVTGVGCAANGARADLGSAHVVVVGGGSGGATAAKYLKVFAPEVQVTLIEPNATYYTCYGSNWVIGGIASMDDIGHNYETLKSKYGINVVADSVTDVDASGKTVRTAGGQTIRYDRLVMSPGIDFNYDGVAGITASDANRIPHAWKAGEQTQTLRAQLEAMPNGGTFVMVAPGNPFRCPPGPYERASMVAHYFKANKPRSKIIILDNKENFSKQGLFTAGWDRFYGDMIEWVPSSRGGQVEEVDTSTLTCISDGGFTRVKADVLNFVPSQRAGEIAAKAGLTNDVGWCPVNQQTFESTIHANIHVIGDASVAGAMPKSGHSANNQGKVAAASIIRSLRGQDPLVPSTTNTCYSLVAPDYAISVAAVYTLGSDGTIVGVEGAGGLSPADADDNVRAAEARYTQGWYDGITSDIFS
ncbi:MAG: NAD(P)/FAD-dependent oxidoreductase [Thioalkalivibrionaceae bacterium]